ncbi:hypothetical protein N4T77_18340 [Clostridium sp. CX1]|uniref:hypothetical protein n=1 Tax=Clostridium sp. CX1 TaxID=2978346 RepID=UPI0021C1FC92|nr:hypothetical protein [Clostridium sp. CX1]MCT8978552.1 hypothetical protein [Clostridium sp. CX1]
MVNRSEYSSCAKLDLYFDGKDYEPFAAPIDIKLKKEKEEHFQKVIPDIVVICDKDEFRGISV